MKLPDYLCSALREASLTLDRLALEHEACSIPDAGWSADECSCPHHRLARTEAEVDAAIERAVAEGVADASQFRVPTDQGDGVGGHRIPPGLPTPGYDDLLRQVQAHRVHCPGRVFDDSMVGRPCPICCP